ncbi:hypothetical protein Adt_04913 [Abeliophyllum distichum]|uniref:Uncharacterized protein n=1 Tax=Abeliophyllum distichum TaxID=126358 RepID=A0ABD1V2X4_9LAMI
MAYTTKTNEEIDLTKTADLAHQAASLRSKDDSVPFEELYDKLIDHETYLGDLDSVFIHSNAEINATTVRPLSNNQASSNYRSSSSNQRNSHGRSQQPPASSALGLLPYPNATATSHHAEPLYC